MMLDKSAVEEETLVADTDTLPMQMVRTVPAPRVWIFVESADASCDVALFQEGDLGASWRTWPAEGGNAPTICIALRYLLHGDAIPS